jgi:putative SOS response-associated peptidase YedK
MCGRYVAPEEAAMERFWKIDRRNWNPLGRRFNVAPTTNVPIIRRAEDGAYELCEARWGLIPNWWKKNKPPTLTFNARSEEAAVKPTWRHSYRHMRCLMPAQGWYEWNERESAAVGSGKGRATKQPYYIHCESSPVIAFAGLFAYWQAPEGELVVSCALLSKAVAPSIVKIHDRMPVVLSPDSFEAWLATERSVEEIGRLIECAREDFSGYPVSTKVNNTRNDSPDLIQDISGTF